MFENDNSMELINHEPDLPLPYVFYPGESGMFFCFSDALDGKLYICDCFRDVLSRYLKISRPAMDSEYFPERLGKVLSSADSRRDFESGGFFEFREGICHQCCGVTPSLVTPLAAPNAKSYRWYVQKRMWEYGFYANGQPEGALPPELSDLAEQTRLCTEEITDTRTSLRRQNVLYKQKSELMKKITRLVEEEVKKRFDYPILSSSICEEKDDTPRPPAVKYCRSLPFKYAVYPVSEFGAFMAFSQSRDCDELFLCECMREAVENLIAFNTQRTDMLFPKGISLESVSYREKLCHRCNTKKPPHKTSRVLGEKTSRKTSRVLGEKTSRKTSRVPDEIPFTYINLKYIEYGILRFHTLNLYSPMLCPAHIRPLIDRLTGKNPYGEAARSLYSQINKLVEGDVQSEFGMKRSSERWASESKLYRIVRELFPDCAVFTHKRFEWMYYLEFDIYVEDLRLAIEYQGIQHFEPQEHWGGRQALEETRERDEIKAELCKEHNIELVTFNYDEELTEEAVRAKLYRFIKEPITTNDSY